MTDDISWLILVAILPVTFYVSSTWHRLRAMERKLDLALQSFDGLRRYLYEIDPQFNDEREAASDMGDENNLMAAQDDMALLERKQEEGRRTLNTTFHE